MGSEKEGVIMTKRTEIDTRAPFQSVKEAVRLFGEKILAGEVYVNKLKETHLEENENGQESPSSSRVGKVMAELKETKQNLQKAEEESLTMAHCLASLQEELERTKRELKQLKLNETPKQVESQIEDVRIIDDLTKFVVKSQVSNEGKADFKKNKYVTFANSLPLAQVIVPPCVEALETHHPSLRKKKKKPLIPSIGGIFSKKK